MCARCHFEAMNPPIACAMCISFTKAPFTKSASAHLQRLWPGIHWPIVKTIVNLYLVPGIHCQLILGLLCPPSIISNNIANFGPEGGGRQNCPPPSGHKLATLSHNMLGAHQWPGIHWPIVRHPLSIYIWFQASIVNLYLAYCAHPAYYSIMLPI